MSKQVVGFFDAQAQAQQVRQELLGAGFEEGDITLLTQDQEAAIARGEVGFWERIKEFFGAGDYEDQDLYREAARRGWIGLLVDADSDAQVDQITGIFRHHHVRDLDEESGRWRQEGWGPAGYTQKHGVSGTAPAAVSRPAPVVPPAATPPAHIPQPIPQPAAAQGEQVIPIVQEDLQVAKRQVLTGGVRVYTRVVGTPVEKQVQVRQEHVQVERRPVDRPAASGETAFQERTIETTELREEPVVHKDARVVEEVIIRKDVEHHDETIREDLRHTEVDVEKLDAAQAADAFARTLAHDPKFRGRDWNTIEPEARRAYEARYPNQGWEQVRESIHRGYDQSRQEARS